MTHLLFTSGLALLIFIPGCSFRVRDDLWSHGLFSAASAGAVTAVTEDPVMSAGIVLGVGVLKEALDALRGTGFDPADLAANLTGSVMGAAAADRAMKGMLCWKR